MIKSIIRRFSGIKETGLTMRFNGFISSIYGRVVLFIVGSFIILLICLNILFHSLYADYFNNTLRQTGDNVSSIVEGALYYSMLENDKLMLQRTLDVISTMSGIDEVSLYNQSDSLAFTSSLSDFQSIRKRNDNQYFDDNQDGQPGDQSAYHILEYKTEGGSDREGDRVRQLLIRKRIYNEPSCYTANCHAHSQDELILGSLIVKLPLRDLDALMVESSNDFILLVTLITILLVSILILFTKKKIQKPLKSIIRASEAVSGGKNNIRLDINSSMLHDMRKVSLAFNNMLDKIEATAHELQNWSHQLEYKVQKKTEELMEVQNELIHVERIASLGKLSSSVAHEINNPLSGILVYTKLIQKQLNKPEFRIEKKESILKILRFIETETKRCGEIVKGLLDFSRKDQEDFEMMDLHKLLDITYKLMQHSITIAGIHFTRDYQASTSQIKCSPNQIKQAFVALLVNSTEAINEHGEITIRTSNPEPDKIKVEIIDNGQGIAKRDIQHIFEPFFSTKHNVSGIGLGLSIVYGIVENHNGRIEVDSEIGKGTTMSIHFPLAESKVKLHGT
jgi:two-component system NtrC family sensor kinase